MAEGSDEFLASDGDVKGTCATLTYMQGPKANPSGLLDLLSAAAHC